MHKTGLQGNKTAGRNREILTIVISTVCGTSAHGLNVLTSGIFEDSSLMACDVVLFDE
jgi:hypothetical protein